MSLLGLSAAQIRANIDKAKAEASVPVHSPVHSEVVPEHSKQDKKPVPVHHQDKAKPVPVHSNNDGGTPPEQSSKTPTGLELPIGYALDGKQLVTTGDKPRVVAYEAFWPTAELVQANDEGALLEVECITGRKITFERRLIHDRTLVQVIEGASIPLVYGAHLAADVGAYLSAFIQLNSAHIPRKQARTSTGWSLDRRSFLLGSECVGESTDVLNLPAGTSEHAIVNAIRTHGSADLWRDTATAFLSECPVAGIVLAAAIASPMLQLFGWSPIALALSSEGGAGKSTLLRLGLSTFGGTGGTATRQVEGLAGNGNSTLLALAGQFACLDDLPHFADEVKVNLGERKALGDIASALHTLVDGQPRGAMSKNGALQNRRRTHGCTVLCTETDTGEIFKQTGVKRRIIPVRGPYSDKPLGRFNDVLCSNYGHAGRGLVQALVQANDETRRNWADLERRHLEKLPMPDGSNEVFRTWRAQFAVAMAAVDVACVACPMLFPDVDLWLRNVKKLWLALSRATDAPEADMALEAYENTVSWLGGRRQNLEPSVAFMAELHAKRDYDSGFTREPQRKEWIGRIKKAESEGQDGAEKLLVVDVRSSELTAHLQANGWSLRTLSRRWLASGWLEPDGKGRLDLSSYVGGTPGRVYRVVMPASSTNSTE